MNAIYSFLADHINIIINVGGAVLAAFLFRN